MNRSEAESILNAVLGQYQALDYATVVSLVNAPKETREIVAESGVRYDVDIRASWDDDGRADVRVACSIDDGGVSAFLPLTRDFIKEP